MEVSVNCISKTVEELVRLVEGCRRAGRYRILLRGPSFYISLDGTWTYRTSAEMFPLAVPAQAKYYYNFRASARNVPVLVTNQRVQLFRRALHVKAQAE
jgi:hypothetical protein